MKKYAHFWFTWNTKSRSQNVVILIQKIGKSFKTSFEEYASLRQITSSKRNFANSSLRTTSFQSRNWVTSPIHHFAEKRHFTKEASLRQKTSLAKKNWKIFLTRLRFFDEMTLFWRSDTYFGDVTYFSRLKSSAPCGEMTHWQCYALAKWRVEVTPTPIELSLWF